MTQFNQYYRQSLFQQNLGMNKNAKNKIDLINFCHQFLDIEIIEFILRYLIIAFL